ncbi:hypothetical protein [Chelativorans alearense]|uniref:hypothetical protein n=1 Tax=Chelativorans alearense TaxID=2681495 RepID=UPI0013D7DDA2|nr:hypothetical protein [Chelativorans alearense]
MADTKLLTDHNDIREWAAARAGQPALSDPTPGMAESEPILSFAFGQRAYQDTDEGADRPGGVQPVEWDEWFRLFEERRLALVVSRDVPGQREEFHEFVRRP